MKPGFLYASFICLIIFAGLSSFSPTKTSNLVDDVFTETNLFRKSNRLPVLQLNEDLNAIAQQHSNNMAKGKVAFGHNGFEKRNKMAVKNMNGISKFAENVLFGASTGKDAVNMWKNSEGHRKNLLGKFRYIGIGIAKDKQGRIYYTEIFAG